MLKLKKVVIMANSISFEALPSEVQQLTLKIALNGNNPVNPVGTSLVSKNFNAQTNKVLEGEFRRIFEVLSPTDAHDADIIKKIYIKLFKDAGLQLIPVSLERCNELKLNIIKFLSVLPQARNLWGMDSFHQRSLTTLNENLRSWVKETPELTKLSFYSRNLTHLHPVIGTLGNLTKLDLNHNLLTALPSEIRHLTNLITLTLSNNKLITLPPEIGNLTSLRLLNLEHNQLNTLPPEIGNLTSLRTLNLEHNQLTTLPPEIKELQSLMLLCIKKNSFEEIPRDLHLWIVTNPSFRLL